LQFLEVRGQRGGTPPSHLVDQLRGFLAVIKWESPNSCQR
jgi:hypothetical protein